MKNIKSIFIILLVTFAMIWSGVPTIGYAQWLNPTDEVMEDEKTPEEFTEPEISQEPQTPQKSEEQEDISTFEESEFPQDNTDSQDVMNEIPINIFFVNKNTGEELEQLNYTALANEEVDYTDDVNNTLKELEINKYFELSRDELNFIVESPSREDSIDLYVYCEYRPFTVTFKYLSSDKSIQEDYIENIAYGSYDFSKMEIPEIEGYEYQSIKGNVKGTIEGDSTKLATEEEIKEKSILVEIIYSQVNNNPTDSNEPAPDSKEEPIQDPIEFKIPVNYCNIDEVTGEYISKTNTIYYDSYEDFDADYNKFKNKPSDFTGTFDKYVYHHTVVVYYCDGSIDVLSFFGRVNPNGKYTIKINYLEEGTNKILANSFVSQKIETGDKYNVSTLANLRISGYEPVRTVGTTKGTVNGKDIEINVYYKKIQQYTVTVNYIDYNKKESIIKSYVSVKINSGESYDVSKYDALKITGYDYYMTNGDPLKGTLNKNKVINVYYVKNGEEVVNTGEDSILLWVVAGVGAVIAIAAILIFKRKSNK